MSYTWETLEIEQKIQTALIRDLGRTHGDTRFGYYVTTRSHLLENVLEEIKAVQPTMTDHGPKHIRDVLQNIDDLLGDSIGRWDRDKKELQVGALNGMELYILGLTALFHDVGNVFERSEHQKQIGLIYDSARPALNGFRNHEEKQITLDICKAHCGDGVDGSKNTLQFVAERSKLDRKEVRPKLIAPILRFADELAEGEQRTSHLMMRLHAYPKESIPFHLYASCSSVDIDRSHGRICLKYHIALSLPGEEEVEMNRNSSTICTTNLTEFLDFVYRRIEKLNQERQYAKHYCALLDIFKETSASLNFWYRGQPVPVDLPAIVMSDLVVPNDPQKSVVDRDNQYRPTDLVCKLSQEMQRMGTQAE